MRNYTCITVYIIIYTASAMEQYRLRFCLINRNWELISMIKLRFSVDWTKLEIWKLVGIIIAANITNKLITKIRFAYHYLINQSFNIIHFNSAIQTNLYHFFQTALYYQTTKLNASTIHNASLAPYIRHAHPNTSLPARFSNRRPGARANA